MFTYFCKACLNSDYRLKKTTPHRCSKCGSEDILISEWKKVGK